MLLVAAYGSDAARQADATSLLGFVAVEPNGGSLPDRLAHFGDPGAVILIGALLAGIAALRGRPRVAAAIVLLIGITSVSSQALKAVLAYPRYEGTIGGAHVAPEAFPSGHSTAAMAIALCLVLAAPARLRPLAALVGAGFALGVAFSVIALGWHFPSDAVGGFLLASGWALVLMAGLAYLDERYPARSGRTRAQASDSGRHRGADRGRPGRRSRWPARSCCCWRRCSRSASPAASWAWPSATPRWSSSPRRWRWPPSRCSPGWRSSAASASPPT